MPKIGFLLSLAAVIGGFVWIFTVGSLFGVLLIMGGMGALFVLVVPAGIERVAEFLSTGTLRRWK